MMFFQHIIVKCVRRARNPKDWSEEDKWKEERKRGARFLLHVEFSAEMMKRTLI